ncbi:MAG: ATP:cob(I)alamin adenosyltransferase [Candidatus Paceibacterota bacterium]|jgi:cob(I)alamin adenosyltransferase
MLYTRKGDDGTTKTFGCDQRISKSSAIAEALGSLDEINSFLGICKVKSELARNASSIADAGGGKKLTLADGTSFEKMIHEVQKNLFIIQAEIAGSKMSISEDKIKEIEIVIDYIEHELPPIKSFFISGGTELATFFDIARTIARRAERRVIGVSDEGKIEISDFTKSYLNRLSSFLYAMARLTNHKFGITEESPDYK